MEGWDANRDGSPSEHTLRRWRQFRPQRREADLGRRSGRRAARRPGQPESNAGRRRRTRPAWRRCLNELPAAHRDAFGTTDDLLVGLQLTHSGRFCRPNDKQLEPRIAYHHPLLDAKFGIDPDDDSRRLDRRRPGAADRRLRRRGRPGPRGRLSVRRRQGLPRLSAARVSQRPRRAPASSAATSTGRTRLLVTIIGRIRDDVSRSARRRAAERVRHAAVQDEPRSRPADGLPASAAVRATASASMRTTRCRYDLTEPIRAAAATAGGWAWRRSTLSCGSPYYNPHIQRPAIFPPSDGYQPPEDPLVGVVRQIQAARALQSGGARSAAGRHRLFVPAGLSAARRPGGRARQAGSTSSAWAAWCSRIPNCRRHARRAARLERKKICRTFSDCTTAPRNGLISRLLSARSVLQGSGPKRRS